MLKTIFMANIRCFAREIPKPAVLKDPMHMTTTSDGDKSLENINKMSAAGSTPLHNALARDSQGSDNDKYSVAQRGLLNLKLDFINHFIIRNPMTKKRSKYRKMSLKTKIIFLKRVIEEGQSIKKVSAECNINYSTAKTLIRNQKLKKSRIRLSEFSFEDIFLEKQPAETIEQPGIVCSYRSLVFDSVKATEPGSGWTRPRIEVVCSISFP